MLLLCIAKLFILPSMSHPSTWARPHFGPRLPLTLLALFLPAGLFVLGLFLVRRHPRFTWLADVAEYPWELWMLAVAGLVATVGGVLDWAYHRSGRTTVGGAEHRSELLALAGGGLPLFLLMAA